MTSVGEIARDPLTEMVTGIGVLAGGAVLEESINQPTAVISLAISSAMIIHGIVREHRRR